MKKTATEIADKIRSAFDDQDEFYSWTIGAEVLAGIMEDESIKKFNEQLKKGDTITAADIFESLGLDRESAPDFEFKPSKKTNKPKKSVKPAYKTYEDLAYISAMESSRCHMLIDKLKAYINLLDAQQQYYEEMSVIERDNEMFGFDLSI